MGSLQATPPNRSAKPLFSQLFEEDRCIHAIRHGYCTEEVTNASRVPAEFTSALVRERQSRKRNTPGYTAG
jgi:hypothetical protein